MNSEPLLSLSERLAGLNVKTNDYAAQFVDTLLAAAGAVGASDIHLQPTSRGLEVHWRLDGVLQSVGVFPRGEATDVVTRLKVLAELLTYRTDVPQEGRIRLRLGERETRVSVFPTLHGERAVVRLFAAAAQFTNVDDLGLPQPVTQSLRRLLTENSGMILITGPAGSGKTTTAYACLREIAGMASGGKCLVSLEDPIEVEVPGVAQSQANRAAGFDLATGLRSLVRQDPEVIFVGEIRDRETAEVAFQASLTGHLVLTTFHAGSAGGAIGRLIDMEIEPYLLRSGVLAILNQRLLRRLCVCAVEADDEASRLGLPVARCWRPVGCAQCLGTGYRGRLALAELFQPSESQCQREILKRGDATELDQQMLSAGMTTRWQLAHAAVAAGETSPQEIRRALGFRRE